MFFVYSGFRVDGTNMHKPSCLLDVGRAEKPAAGERNRHIIYKEFRPEIWWSLVERGKDFTSTLHLRTVRKS